MHLSDSHPAVGKGGPADALPTLRMQLTTLHNGLPAYQFELLADWPVEACVSTRAGGVSEPPFDSLNFSTRRGDTEAAVGTNIERFSRACGFRREDLVWAGQIRSDAVCEATDVHRGTRLAGTDGLVTSEVRLPLMTLYADCVPIVIYDTVHHRLGVAHAGWQGTVKRIAEQLLQQLGRRYGTIPADCVAGLGPSIGPDSYEIGDDVIQLVRATQEDADSLLRPSVREGRAYFNLWEANRRQLATGGVPGNRIEIGGLDTAALPDTFFSHRTARGRCGLFGMLCWLEPRFPSVP